MTLSDLYQQLLAAAFAGDVVGDATVTINRADLQAALAELERTGILEPRNGFAASDIDAMEDAHTKHLDRLYPDTPEAEFEVIDDTDKRVVEIARIVRHNRTQLAVIEATLRKLVTA